MNNPFTFTFTLKDSTGVEHIWVFSPETILEMDLMETFRDKYKAGVILS